MPQLLATLFPVAAGFGFLLGAVHLMIWSRLRARMYHLFAGLMGLAAGFSALCELSYLGTPTVQDFDVAFKIQGVLIVATLVSMVWFMHFRLRIGLVWLCWAITAVQLVSVVVAYLLPGDLGAEWTTAIDIRSTPWGETYAVPSGEIDDTKYIADFGTLLIIVYVVWSTLRLLRRRRLSDAIAVSAPILFFIVVAGIHTPLVDAGVVHTPYLISIFFVAISAALAVDLVSRVAKSAALSMQLAVERERWVHMLNKIQLVVIRFDRNGRIAYVNPFFETLSARSAQQMMGQTVEDVFADTDLSSVRALSQNPDSDSARMYHLRRFGGAEDRKDLVCFAVELRGADDQFDGLFLFGRDVTELRRAEQERDANRRDLEKLTRVLTMGELASSLAHELSQPLAAILSNAQTLEILQTENPDPDIAETVADVIADARRARDLMNGIRGFVVDAAPEKQWFDLNQAIDDVLSMVGGDAARHRVRLVSEPPQGPARIHAARVEIQQVVTNLLVNAVQAVGDTGAGKVKIGWSVLADGSVALRVDDNGPGIPEDRRGRIFDAFVTSKSEGTGIGLAVSRRIIQRHSGTIEVSASAMGGARFDVHLPSEVLSDASAAYG